VKDEPHSLLQSLKKAAHHVTTRLPACSTDCS